MDEMEMNAFLYLETVYLQPPLFVSATFDVRNVS